jgi:hypothetical protein
MIPFIPLVALVAAKISDDEMTRLTPRYYLPETPPLIQTLKDSAGVDRRWIRVFGVSLFDLQRLDGAIEEVNKNGFRFIVPHPKSPEEPQPLCWWYYLPVPEGGFYSRGLFGSTVSKFNRKWPDFLDPEFRQSDYMPRERP